MSYQTLHNQRQSFSGTDAEFIAFANEVIETRKSLGQTANFISLRTVRFLFGAEVAASVDAALASDPTAQILFRQADGVDAALDEVQDMIEAFTGQVLTAEQAETLKAYGVNSAKRCQAWGFAEVTEADLSKSANMVAVTDARTLTVGNYNDAAGYIDQCEQNGTAPDLATIQAKLNAGF